MKILSTGAVGILVAALAGATGTFVMVTVVMAQVPDAVTIAAVALGAFLAAAALTGFPNVGPLWAEHRGDALLAAVGGVAAFWAAPLLALSQRASDAPPGSEVAFFTTSAWGLIAIAASVVASGKRGSDRLAVLAAGLMAAVGGATLLANWERPSSFSPFVRFPGQELWMLVAGVLFSVGAVLIQKASARIGVRRTTALAAGSAMIIGIVTAVPMMQSVLPTLGVVGPQLVALGAFGGIFAVSWVWLSAMAGVARAATVWLLVPGALTALTLVERSISVAGPNPIVWSGAAAGIVLSIVGSLVVWAVGPQGFAGRRPSTALGKAVLVAGLAGLGMSVAALFTGSIQADVLGAFSETYHASWTMLGGESASGWLVLALGCMSVAATVALFFGRARTALFASVAALVGAATYPLVLSTPLRTATRWIPADVQQTYGTEYARLIFAPLNDPVRMVALGVVVGVALAISIVAWRLGATRGVLEGAE